jgi:hypothetical protein
VIECWLPAISISPAAINHCGFDAAGSEVHFVYRDGSNLQYSKSVDEGSTFTTAVAIGTTDEIPLTQAVAVDGKYVHVVYCRNTKNAGAPPELYYRRSVDGGTTWDSEVTLDDGTGVGNNRFVRVSLRAQAGHVHLFWCTQNGTTFVPDVLSYRRSVDNGTTWVAETTLGGSTGASRPEATLTGSTIHLVWTDTRDGTANNGGETYYLRSTDRGATWNTAAALSSTADHGTARATICADGAVNVVVAWQDSGATGGNEDVYWRYSSDGGSSWSTAATLVTGTAEQEHPTLVAKDGVVALCWNNFNDTPNTVHTKLSRDGGATWAAVQTPYTPASDSASPTMSFSRRFLMVLDRPATEGNQLVRSPVFEADPATVILDDFNRADDGTPPPGTNWTNGVLTFVAGEGIVIVSNQACRMSTGGYRQGGYWNVGEFGSTDMVVELSAWTAAINEGFGLYSRLSQVGSGTTDGYDIDLTHNGTTVDWALQRRTNGAATDLRLAARALAANDKVALTCRGDLIIGWHRASAAAEWTQVFAALDATYQSGFVGLEFLNGQNTKVTNLWASESVATMQAARPDADTTTTGWTTTPLWSKIEEVIADGTVVTATAV